MKMNKKGIAPVIQQGGQALLVLALFLILVGVVYTFGAKFMQDQRDDITSTTSPAYQVANDSLQTVVDASDNTDSYQSVAGIGVVLFILIAIIGYFVYRNRMA